MSFRKRLVSVTVLCGLLVLTGCSANTGYSVLDREPTSADALPAAFLETAEEVDGDTSRFVGNDGGISFWLATGGERSGICLVTHTDDEGWMSLCGGEPREYVSRLGAHLHGLPRWEANTRRREEGFRKHFRDHQYGMSA